MNKSLKQLRKRLARYFKRKDSMNQASFCAFANVQESSFSKFRNGKRDGLSLETYERIIDALERVGK
jgi:DNA-binding Xre family transcriptional regulator